MPDSTSGATRESALARLLTAESEWEERLASCHREAEAIVQRAKEEAATLEATIEDRVARGIADREAELAGEQARRLAAVEALSTQRAEEVPGDQEIEALVQWVVAQIAGERA